MEGSEMYNSKRDEIIISSNVGNKTSNIIQAKFHLRTFLLYIHAALEASFHPTSSHLHLI